MKWVRVFLTIVTIAFAYSAGKKFDKHKEDKCANRTCRNPCSSPYYEADVGCRCYLDFACAAQQERPSLKQIEDNCSKSRCCNPCSSPSYKEHVGCRCYLNLTCAVEHDRKKGEVYCSNYQCSSRCTFPCYRGGNCKCCKDKSCLNEICAQHVCQNVCSFPCYKNNTCSCCPVKKCPPCSILGEWKSQTDSPSCECVDYNVCPQGSHRCTRNGTNCGCCSPTDDFSQKPTKDITYIVFNPTTGEFLFAAPLLTMSMCKQCHHRFGDSCERDWICKDFTL